jgi:hypothetical protein
VYSLAPRAQMPGALLVPLRHAEAVKRLLRASGLQPATAVRRQPEGR